jgi:hypothetical protein
MIMPENKKDYSQFRNIKLDEIPGFFSFKGGVYKVLMENGIHNFEDLFLASENPEFIKIFTRPGHYEEVNQSLKLLKYKFFHEDIVGLDPFDVKLENFGFSSKIINAINMNIGLKRPPFNSDEKVGFLMLFTDSKYSKCLNNFRGMGESSFTEISEKSKIIKAYCEEKSVLKEEDLTNLMTKLKNLESNIKTLNKETELLRKIIEEKLKGVSLK